MTLVPFFLTVHLTVACIFVLAFGFLAVQEREQLAPRWFMAAFCGSAAMALFGFWIPHASNPHLIVVISFAFMLGALLAILIGLHAIYREPVSKKIIGVLIAASMIGSTLIYELPRSSSWHSMFYQLPLCIVQLLTLSAIYRSGMALRVDKILFAIVLVSCLQFASKIVLTVWPGRDISVADQSGEGITLVSLVMGVSIHLLMGLLLLLRTVTGIVGAASEKSEIDALSAIYNRHGFYHHVSHALLRKQPGEPYSVIMSDLDGFKQINDQYGHNGGDKVIAAFGMLLKERLPKPSVCARIGGEEFAVFLPRAAVKQAHTVAELLRAEIERMEFNGGRESWKATASFGVAEAIDGEDFGETIQRADTALYDAKQAGRNRVHIA